MYYLVRRQTQSDEVALTAVTRLLVLMEICLVDRAVLEQAIALRFQDFEDAVQIACAITTHLDGIVTRDLAGFTGTAIPVLSPRELITRLVQ
ncbi:PIN domain-containing protein [Aetokthonos hydrillicola Thurmond2011]|uniref:PIN domain-containing protein n=1 Tax=Aetokthonos hydrillicola Thurmond2011 TaxID=2712845 RepID=A0AAP5MCY0_9CYAN|nr:PIN domain-containing protein [Aetokthonos hydrillicola Thurmond2011]